MRVNDPNLNPAALNQTGANSPASTGATGKTAQLDPVRINSSSSSSARGAERGDQVQLSGLSSKINELQPGSPERESYIEGLRLQVASGQFQPDANSLAQSLVNEALFKVD
jgi:flagellar biosynthesis anti-sigma factor FlgM